MLIKSYFGKTYTYDLKRNNFLEGEIITGEEDNVATSGRLFLPYDQKSLLQILNGHVGYLSVTLTETCNMRCRYCIYSGGFSGHRTHSANVLTVENGKKTLDWFLNHSRKMPKVRIGFYGGEVLTCLDLLKELTTYAETIFKERLEAIYFTTNGLNLNPSVADWISKDEKLIPSITMNGSEEIHDRNRISVTGEPTHKTILANILHLRRVIGSKRFDEMVTVLANYANYAERLQILSFFEKHPELNAVSVLCTQIEFPPENEEGKRVLLDSEHDEQIREETERRAIENVDVSDEEYGRNLARAGIKTEMLRRYHHRAQGVADNLAFPGGCMPFANRMAVDIHGTIHFCESTDWQKGLGNVLDGDSIGRRLDFIDDLEALFNGELDCKHCVAANFCKHCFKEFMSKSGVNTASAIKVKCESMRKLILREMKVYVSVLEMNPGYLQRQLPRLERPEWVKQSISEVIKRKSH